MYCMCWGMSGREEVSMCIHTHSHLWSGFALDVPRFRYIHPDLGSTRKCMCILIHVCMNQCIYECVYVCMHVCLNQSMYVYVCMYVCMYVWINVCVCEVYVHEEDISLCIGNVCMYFCKHTCMYVCMYSKYVYKPWGHAAEEGWWREQHWKAPPERHYITYVTMNFILPYIHTYYTYIHLHVPAAVWRWDISEEVLERKLAYFELGNQNHRLHGHTYMNNPHIHTYIHTYTRTWV